MTLAPLKSGFIRTKTINPRTSSNTQIKIGSKRYDQLVDDYKYNKIFALKQDKKKINITKINRTANIFKARSQLYNNNLEGVRKLVQSRHQFNATEKSKTSAILKSLSNQGYVFNFKIRGETKFSNQYWTLRNENLDDLVNALSNNYFEENVLAYGSDDFGRFMHTGISDFKLTKTEPKKITTKKRLFKKNKNGHFFRYLNTTDINLERYQIISKESNKDILNEHCLIYSLQQAGVDNVILNRIKTTFQQGSSFAKCNLKKIVDILKRKIILYELPTKKHAKIKTIFGKTYDNPIEIALFENHYFINDTTKYTSFSIKHYDEIKHIKDFHDISDRQRHHEGLYSRKKAKKISSLDVIKILFTNNKFKKDDFLLTYTPDFQKLNKNKDDILDGIEQEQQEYKYKEKQTKTRSIFYADSETDTSGNHKPILLGIVKDRPDVQIGHVRTFVNKNDDKNKFWFDFLEYIHRNSKTNNVNDEEVIIYFHNLKYDYHVLMPYLYLSGSPCEKDGNLYSAKIRYRKRIFELRDSFKLANFALAKFQKTFDLDPSLNKKEAIAYDYYKLTNMCVELIKTSDYEKFLRPEEIPIFREAIEKNEYNELETPKKGWFNPIAYYRYYLKYDCLILAKGLQKFKQTIDIISENKLDMYNYLTISSLTYAMMGLNGSFDDVYEMTGNLRDFCSQAVTGGRVQTNAKYEKQVLNGKFADYDGVSLYPSAIKRLCEERGLPLGKCKRIETHSKVELDKHDYYIVKVKISKINKHQQLPMVSYKDDEGLLQYINDIEEPIMTYIDMISLSDWIKFQEIEYEIIDGVYWNEGYNKKMGDVIKHLFEERLKQKKQGNEAMQQILKLMMNSAYGKTITKKTTTKNIITNEKYRDNYIHNNFNTIRKITDLNEKLCSIEVDTVDLSYNMSQVGAFVLSYSKRIMNEVFDVANTNNYPLYYTDTDSIHCNYDDVPLLEQKFKEKYNRELTGKQLGQFHVDFDMKGAVGEIVATKSIFLGKKSYIDQLESVDKDGKKIVDYHYRMKGCTVAGLEDKANRKYKGNMFELYTKLLNGKEMKIIMNPKNSKPMFEYSDNAISTRRQGKFIRTIQF